MNETTADRRITRTAQAIQHGNRNLWEAAILAASIVGEYAEGGTRAIADRAGRSVSSVENWAHAWQLYADLRNQLRTCAELRSLRPELSVTHFAVMWDAVNKWGIVPADVMQLLRWMVSCKQNGERWSVDALRRELDAEYNHDGQPRLYAWYAKRAHTAVSELLSMPDASRDVRTAAMALLELLNP